MVLFFVFKIAGHLEKTTRPLVFRTNDNHIAQLTPLLSRMKEACSSCLLWLDWLVFDTVPGPLQALFESDASLQVRLKYIF